MEFTHEILARLEKLEQKYTAMGQDMSSYLDGLLQADFLTYWDYVHLDTLLSLQTPRTPWPDEEIFILYHQITELYFKLTLNAIKLIQKAAKEGTLNGTYFKRQIKRVNSYFNHLVTSFDIMVDGMDKEEFLKFRMSLLPASGFQSAQYRKIEIHSTDMPRLVHHAKRNTVGDDADEKTCYESIYWRFGATELATGRKTLTLKQFERKYSGELIQLAKNCKEWNLWQCYKKLPLAEQEDEELIDVMRKHDLNANVNWSLAHYRSAVRYLNRQPKEIAATGGTNWQKYLPPKFQFVVFYPELWTAEELNNWGKTGFAMA